MGSPAAIPDTRCRSRYLTHFANISLFAARWGRIVGTYRILAPSAAHAKWSGYYWRTSSISPPCNICATSIVGSAARASIPLSYRCGDCIAVVRTCPIHEENGYDYLMMAAASISMGDGGHAAMSLYNRLKDSHMSPA